VRLNLVSTSTGNLAFAINDLELSGVMPILFQRVYDSSRRDADYGLGTGWSFAFDDRISLDDDGATLTTGAGASVPFRGDGQHFVLRQDAPGLHQSFDVTSANTITESAAGFARTYQKLGGAYRLSRIADLNGNAITISFDARGNMARIENGSAAIVLAWSNDKNSRLLSVADSAGRRVSFKQDGQRLRSFIDAAGAQWSYDYANNQLTAATDPLGRTLLRARYDRAGRAIEAGDAAGLYNFEYGAVTAAISRQTVVTDPVGAKTYVTHNENGALTGVGDDEGQTIAVEYNAANRPTRMLDALGNETKFAYDAGNRLSRQISSDGALDKSYTYDANGRIVSTTDGGVRADYNYDARGNVSAKQSSDAAQGYEAQRNARGQAIRLTGKNGRTVLFEYDASGNETAFTYSDAGRFESEFDAAGRRVAERLPSGATIRSEYDARGKLARQSDSGGRSINITRDASGAVTELASGSGRWVRATRDGAGRIVTLTNSSGKSRRFAYDARGALTDYVDARGRSRKMRYDRRGRLQSVTDSDGVSFLYDYDRAGRLVAVRRADRKEAGSFLSLPARYNPALPPPTLVQGVDCFFGGDGFGGGGDMISLGSDPFDPKNCDDPFGVFGTGGGGGGGGLLGGGVGGFNIINGESRGTCYDCQKRELDICRLQLDAELRTVLAGAIVTDVACLTQILLPWRYFTCLIAAVSANGLLNDAARSKAEACKLAMVSKCKSECPGLIFP
jgi:YD repeat-containing protein